MAVFPAYSSTFSGQLARIIRVGKGLNCHFKHITDAISASQPYDRVEVESGDYYEAISIVHPLELAGANDDELPCINARGPCVTVNEGGPVLIENIRVIAKGCKQSDSMAVLVVHGSPVIRNCLLSALHVVNDSSPTVTYTNISNSDCGCGLKIDDTAGGEYSNNDICFHPEECIRIQSVGRPNLHHNRILQKNPCRAVVVISGGMFAAEADCRPVFTDNIVSGNGEVSLGESIDPAILLTPSELIGANVCSAEALVHVSWGANPVLNGNYLCNGSHGFLFGGTSISDGHFSNNRIANCRGWAVVLGEGTTLTMVGTEIQECGGAVRVVNNRHEHFGKNPIEAPMMIPLVRSSSIVMNKDDDELCNPRSFRRDLITALRSRHTADEEEAGVFISKRSQRRSTVTMAPSSPLSRPVSASKNKKGIITIANCTFRRNRYFGVFIRNSAVLLTKSKFSENTVGLLVGEDCTRCELVKNTFESNLVAAVMCFRKASVLLEDNNIVGGPTANTCRLFDYGANLTTATVGSSSSVKELEGNLNVGSAVSSYGICITEGSIVQLRKNTLSGSNTSIAVRDGSMVHIQENTLQHGRAHHVHVSNNSHLTLRKNTISECDRAGIAIVGRSRATVSANHIHACSQEGVLVSGGSHVRVSDNIMHACAQSLSVQTGGVLYANGNTMTLGGNGVVISGNRSECVLVQSQIVTATTAFVRASGTCSFIARDCQFDCSTGVGIQLEDGVYASIEKCELQEAKDGIISASSSSVTDATEVHIRKCKMMNSANVGVTVKGNVKGVVSHCTIDRCDTAAVCLGKGSAVDVFHTVIRACAGIGIETYSNSRIAHCAVDGWNQYIQDNSIIGIRASGNSEALIEKNTLTDCHIGIAVESNASVKVRNVTVHTPVDAGVVVCGAAVGTRFEHVVVDGSDSCGIVLRESAQCEFLKCIVTDAAHCSVVCSSAAETALNDCSFASEACEVLVDSDHTLPMESGGLAIILNSLSNISKKYASSGGGGRRRSSCVEFKNAPTAGVHPLFKRCTVGGVRTKQCIVSFRGEVEFKHCKLQAGCYKEDLANTTHGTTIRKGRKQLVSGAIAAPNPVTQLAIKNRIAIEEGLGVLVCDAGLCVVRKCSIELCRRAALSAFPEAQLLAEQCTVRQCEYGFEGKGSPASVFGSSRGDVKFAAVRTDRTYTRENCNVVLDQVTIEDCSEAGVFGGVGSACVLEASTVDRCKDGLVLADRAFLSCQNVRVQNCEQNGLSISGQPMYTSLLQNVRIEGCGMYGVVHMPSLKRPESSKGILKETSSATAYPLSAVAGVVTLKGSQILSCGQGGAILEGQMRFEECIFQSSAPFNAASKGSGCRNVFSECHFGSCEGQQLIVERAAHVMLRKSVIEGGDGGILVQQAMGLDMEESMIRGCKNGVVFAPSRMPAYDQPAAKPLSRAASAHSDRGFAASVRSMQTHDEEPADTLSELSFEGCSFVDCGTSFTSVKKAIEWNTVKASSPRHRKDRSLVQLRVQFSKTTFEGGRVCDVELGRFCESASLSGCMHTRSACAVRLAHELFSAREVSILGCKFAQCGVAIEVNAGSEVHIVGCSFEEQSGHDVALHSGQKVDIRKNRFSNTRTGSILVEVTAYSILRDLRKDAKGSHQEVAASWAERMSCTAEWTVSDNTFIQAAVGILVPWQTPLRGLQPAIHFHKNAFELCQHAIHYTAKGDRDDERITKELADIPPALLTIVHPSSGTTPLAPSITANTFTGNNVGCQFSAAYSPTVMKNTFAKNSISGLVACGGAKPVVADNVFEGHGEDLRSVAEAPDHTHCGVVVKDLAGGQISSNHFHHNVTGLFLRDASDVIVSENLFGCNVCGLSVNGDYCSGTVTNNTFTAEVGWDIHVSSDGVVKDDDEGQQKQHEHLMRFSYNRFVSFNIPYAVKIGHSASAMLYGNLFCSSPIIALQVDPHASVQVFRNLFYGVGIAISSEEHSSCYMVESAILQHTEGAILANSTSAINAQRCVIMCYPEKIAIRMRPMSVGCFQLCRFVSAHRLQGSLESVFLCTQANLTLSQCYFPGRQTGIVAENRSKLYIMDCCFNGGEVGIIARSSTEMHVHASIFWHHRFASIRLHDGACGEVAGCSMVDNTVLAMGSHSVDITDTVGLASSPFVGEPEIPTVAENEERILRWFTQYLLAEPKWTMSQSQVDDDLLQALQEKYGATEEEGSALELAALPAKRPVSKEAKGKKKAPAAPTRSSNKKAPESPLDEVKKSMQTTMATATGEFGKARSGLPRHSPQDTAEAIRRQVNNWESQLDTAAEEPETAQEGESPKSSAPLITPGPAPSLPTAGLVATILDDLEGRLRSQEGAVVGNDYEISPGSTVLSPSHSNATTSAQYSQEDWESKIVSRHTRTPTPQPEKANDEWDPNCAFKVDKDDKSAAQYRRRRARRYHPIKSVNTSRAYPIPERLKPYAHSFAALLAARQLKGDLLDLTMKPLFTAPPFPSYKRDRPSFVMIDEFPYALFFDYSQLKPASPHFDDGTLYASEAQSPMSGGRHTSFSPDKSSMGSSWSWYHRADSPRYGADKASKSFTNASPEDTGSRTQQQDPSGEKEEEAPMTAEENVDAENNDGDPSTGVEDDASTQKAGSAKPTKPGGKAKKGGKSKKGGRKASSTKESEGTSDKKQRKPGASGGLLSGLLDEDDEAKAGRSKYQIPPSDNQTTAADGALSASEKQARKDRNNNAKGSLSALTSTADGSGGGTSKKSGAGANSLHGVMGSLDDASSSPLPSLGRGDRGGLAGRNSLLSSEIVRGGDSSRSGSMGAAVSARGGESGAAGGSGGDNNAGAHGSDLSSQQRGDHGSGSGSGNAGMGGDSSEMGRGGGEGGDRTGLTGGDGSNDRLPSIAGSGQQKGLGNSVSQQNMSSGSQLPEISASNVSLNGRKGKQQAGGEDGGLDGSEGGGGGAGGSKDGLRAGSGGKKGGRGGDGTDGDQEGTGSHSQGADGQSGSAGANGEDEGGSLPPLPNSGHDLLHGAADASGALGSLRGTEDEEDFEDVIAILHFLAERRQQLGEDVYDSVMSMLMSDEWPFFTVPPQGGDGAQPSGHRSGSADVVYVPLPPTQAEASGAANTRRCVAVRLTRGGGANRLSAVAVPIEFVPPNAGASSAAGFSWHRARCSMVKRLQETHPDVFDYDTEGSIDGADLSATRLLLRAGYVTSRTDSPAPQQQFPVMGAAVFHLPGSGGLSYEELLSRLAAGNTGGGGATSAAAAPQDRKSSVAQTYTVYPPRDGSLQCRRTTKPQQRAVASGSARRRPRPTATSVTEFNPARPAETTPFHDDNRPLTFYSGSAMKW